MMDPIHALDCDGRCGGTYACNRCERTFGWCAGSFDDTPALCDECANFVQEDIHMVRCADNGDCGDCACPCHTDVAVPGPHIATCKFANPEYCPPDFAATVRAMLGGGGDKAGAN